LGPFCVGQRAVGLKITVPGIGGAHVGGEDREIGSGFFSGVEDRGLN